MMSLIQITDLTFAYDGSYDNIFEHTSIALDSNWRLGFTGRNGRGKTTLLRLLMGELPFRGSIQTCVEFGYFPYPVADGSCLSIDVVEQLYPEYQHWQLLRELNALELEEEVLYRPFDTLSGGEQTKLMLALLFLKENRFLLIDEPTNHLDLTGREQVSRYLRTKRGFILVSHDRAFLDGCVDHILSINRSGLELTRGNFSTWYENKQRRDAFELAENARLRKEISRLEQTAREKSRWADAAERSKFGVDPLKVDKPKNYRSYQGAKSAKAQSRAKAIDQRRQAAIEEKSQLLKDIERSDELKIFQTPFHSRTLARLKDVSIHYGDSPVCSGITFDICQGDRIALRGVNGSGKSSILNLLRGAPIPFTGELRLGSGLTISHVPQDTGSLRGSLADLARSMGVELSLLLAMLAKLDVPKAQTEKPLSALSAGQKKKVLLACSICQPAHLHIWDEPMNYIDVFSRMQLEELLLTFRPTMLFVEHDRAFCERIATRIIKL